MHIQTKLGKGDLYYFITIVQQREVWIEGLVIHFVFQLHVPVTAFFFPAMTHGSLWHDELIGFTVDVQKFPIAIFKAAEF